VLGPQQLQPYIEACQKEQKRIREEFGIHNMDYPFDLTSRDADGYAPRCQGFSFPNGETYFIFDDLGIAGAILFDTDSKKIKYIYPWSKTLALKYGEQAVFDRTFYKIRQDPVNGNWVVTALVFAIFGDRYNTRYETWEFTYGGHSRRYIMQPHRPVNSED